MAIEIYEANTFSMIITWTLADGTAKNLSGATVEAHARDYATGTVVDLAGVVSDASAGQVRISAPAFAFAVSVHDVQVVVTLGGVVRTYAEKLTVKDSIKEAV